jgi:hypothetical protein
MIAFLLILIVLAILFPRFMRTLIALGLLGILWVWAEVARDARQSEPDPPTQQDANKAPSDNAEARNDVLRIRKLVALYASERGETPEQFAQRVNSSPTNVEAFAYAIEKSGGTVEGALRSLEGFSHSLDSPAEAQKPEEEGTLEPQNAWQSQANFK